MAPERGPAPSSDRYRPWFGVREAGSLPSFIASAFTIPWKKPFYDDFAGGMGKRCLGPFEVNGDGDQSARFGALSSIIASQRIGLVHADKYLNLHFMDWIVAIIVFVVLMVVMPAMVRTIKRSRGPHSGSGISAFGDALNEALSPAAHSASQALTERKLAGNERHGQNDEPVT